MKIKKSFLFFEKDTKNGFINRNKDDEGHKLYSIPSETHEAEEVAQKINKYKSTYKLNHVCFFWTKVLWNLWISNFQITIL